MEVQPNEACGDAAVVLEGGSHGLLHQSLHRRAALVVEPDLEAGTDGGDRKKSKMKRKDFMVTDENTQFQLLLLDLLVLLAAWLSLGCVYIAVELGLVDFHL
jgi:hypothetical protein